MSTDEFEYKTLARQIQSVFIDFNVSLTIQPHIVDHNHATPYVRIHISAFEKNIDACMNLVEKIWKSSSFKHTDRLSQLIGRESTLLKDNLPSAALELCLSDVKQYLSGHAYISNHVNGRQYHETIHNIAETGVENPYVSKLLSIYEHINRIEPSYVVTTGQSAEFINTLSSKLDRIFMGTTSIVAQTIQQAPPSGKSHIAYHLPSDIAFNTMAIPSVSYTHELSPYMSLLAKLIKHLRLHPEIREKGGAYGHGAIHNPLQHVFTLNTYRDPHIDRSYDVFHRSIMDLTIESFTEQELLEAKFLMIQELDRVIDPKYKGHNQCMQDVMGLTYTLRQENREKIINATLSDIHKAAVYLQNQDKK